MITVSVSHHFRGRQVSKKQFTKLLSEEALRLTRKELEQAVRRVRCPVHGQAARLRFTGRRCGRLEWVVDGCCQSLIAQIRMILGGYTS